ncbi:type IV secretion system protein [Salmonella enterica]|nr:type IV secretion system protein [Salmonella enterica]
MFSTKLKMPKIPFVKQKIKPDPDGNAILFEEIVYRKDVQMKRIYGWGAVIGILFGLLSLIALIVMLPLKRVDTRIFMVDSMTGQQEEIVSVKGGQLSENTALARFFVQKYIDWREGYNYFRLQQDYDTVMMYSNDAVANDYNQLFKGNQRPQDIYHKGEQTAQITVLSKILTDSSNPDDPDKTAMVRFKKVIKDVTSNNSRTEYWNARLTFRITPQNKARIGDVDDNPLGFVVTSYQAEKENRG